MDLQTLWFILIAVLFTGYFFLEGFDYGVGILLPFLGKNDADRRVILNTIGPFWDGNEVWLLTAGGAMFAAFPHWYATLFSGFHSALVLMLVGLIVRGVAIEYRSKDKRPAWRNLWDWLMFAGSLIPALLWGVAFANILRGVPIDPKMNYVGGFLDLLNPYALLAGLTSLAGLTLHGAIFLSLKTSDDLADKARAAANKLWLPTVVLALALAIATSIGIFASRSAAPIVTSVIACLAVLVIGWLFQKRRLGWAFIANGVAIALAVISVFLGLYPRVMVSSLNPNWSLTIHNASSTPYTLTVMTIVAFIFVPIVLIYQGWSYWVFRERVSRQQPLKY